MNFPIPDKRDRFLWICVAVASFLALIGLWTTIRGFHRTWIGGTYSHGYFVAVFCGWMVWKRRDRIFSGGEKLAVAWLPLLGVSFLWLLAAIMNIQAAQQGLLVLIGLGWVAAGLGGAPLRVLVPIAAMFLLALPVWDPLVPFLQWLTVVVSTVAVTILQIPATVDGEFITLPDGVIQVAATCAGLNSFLVGLTLGAAFCHLFLRRWSTVLAAMGCAAGISMVANWIRVASLTVIGHVSRMQSGLLDDHITYGWIIFTVGLVPMFFLFLRIRRWDSGSRGKMKGPSGTGRPDLARLLMATAAALVGPMVFMGFGAIPAKETAETDPFPAAGISWARTELPLERPFSWRPTFAGEDYILASTYSADGKVVFLNRFVYLDQEQGAELIGSTNRISDPSTVLRERVFIPPDPAGRWVREAIVQTEGGALLVWYWYRVGTKETAFSYRAKLHEIEAFFRRRPDAELIVLTSTCSETDCDAAFRAFLSLFRGGP